MIFKNRMEKKQIITYFDACVWGEKIKNSHMHKINSSITHIFLYPPLSKYFQTKIVGQIRCIQNIILYCKNIIKTITKNNLSLFRMKQYSDFKQGRGEGTVVGNGVVLMGKGGRGLKNVLLHGRLRTYTKVQVYQTTLLSTWRNIKYIQTNYIIS